MVVFQYKRVSIKLRIEFKEPRRVLEGQLFRDVEDFVLRTVF